jgi:hypothetical protein
LKIGLSSRFISLPLFSFGQLDLSPVEFQELPGLEAGSIARKNHWAGFILGAGRQQNAEGRMRKAGRLFQFAGNKTFRKRDERS